MSLNNSESVKPIPGIKPPSALYFDDDLVTNWKPFLQKWNNYKILTNLAAQPEEYQVALLIHTLGDEALRRYNGFHFETEDKDRTTEENVLKFQEHIIGEVNETYERYMFNMRKQSENESFDMFCSTVRVLVKTCNYCNNCVDSLVCDRIVLGIRSPQVREILLRERSLTLEKCIDICRASENAQEKGKVFNNETVHLMRDRDKNKPISVKKKMMKPKKENSFSLCKFCGKKHKFKKELCPAYGKVCTLCKKKNHFAKQCISRNSQLKNVHSLDNNSEIVNAVVEKSTNVLC